MNKTLIFLFILFLNNSYLIAQWKAVNNGLDDTDIYSVTIGGRNLYAGAAGSKDNGGGVYVSTNNGKNWSNYGLCCYSVYSIAVKGDYIFAGSSNGVYLSTDNGISWIEKNKGLEYVLVYAVAVSGNKVFAGTNH